MLLKDEYFSFFLKTGNKNETEEEVWEHTQTQLDVIFIEIS